MSIGITRIFCLAAVYAAVTSCAVSVPDADSVAPEITLNYRVGDGTWTELSAGDDVPDASSGRVYFFALASDDGGIQEVAINAEGEIRASASAGPGEMEAYVDPVSYNAVNRMDSSDDTVFGSRIVSWDFRGSDVSLRDGFTLSSVNLTVTATAVDCHGNMASIGDISLVID